MLTLEGFLQDAADYFDVSDITVNGRGADGGTPLHWMAILGDVDGIRLLIEAGADIDATDEKGNSALHETGMLGHYYAAKKLIELEANTDLKNLSEQTPKALALRYSFMADLFEAEN